MQITKEFLKSLNPCLDGFKWWCAKYGESVELSEFVKAADENWDYVRWLSVRCLTHKSQVKFAVWCAEQVAHLYKASSDIPQKAIDAAKKWIENPSEEKNREAAESAAYDADVAAYAAYVAYADVAASSSAYAYYASYASYAAYASAYASDEKFKKEAMTYLLTLDTIE